MIPGDEPSTKVADLRRSPPPSLLRLGIRGRRVLRALHGAFPSEPANRTEEVRVMTHRIANGDGQLPASSLSALHVRERDWRFVGLLSGNVATVLMSGILALAYLISSRLGEEGGNTLQRWLFDLTHNPLVSQAEGRILAAIVVNLIIGLAFALIYTRFFEPKLSGPGWRNGMLFSLVLWALSAIVFFPAAGLGIFATGIDAGPLPVIGNLIAHLVYGAALGALYAIPADVWLDNTDEDRLASLGAERGAASGMLMGLVLGVPLGFAVIPVLDVLAAPTIIVLASSLTFGGAGLLIGSLMGMGDGPVHDSASR
jgi:hypothetical protein